MNRNVRGMKSKRPFWKISCYDFLDKQKDEIGTEYNTRTLRDDDIVRDDDGLRDGSVLI